MALLLIALMSESEQAMVRGIGDVDIAAEINCYTCWLT